MHAGGRSSNSVNLENYIIVSVCKKINIFGDFSQPTGLGVAAGLTASALERSGCGIARYDLGALSSNEWVDDWIATHSVNLIHTNPDRLQSLCSSSGAPLYRLFSAGKAHIAYWAWEAQSGIPKSWERFRAHVREVWVPSQFVANAVAHHVPCPVVCMPHPVQVLPPQPLSHDIAYFLKGTTYLSIFDTLSGFNRKNPLGLINAWKRAFPVVSDRATLVIKCSNLKNQYQTILRQACSGRSDIVIFCGILTALQMHALIRAADVYVSLHRAEGFGLTMAEAMLYGKPVIATAYSGNLDFMSARNSYLVDFEMETLTSADGYYAIGTQWANPNVEHAAHYIRATFENPEFARSIGEKARLTIARMLSPAAIGDRMQRRISLLDNYNKLL